MRQMLTRIPRAATVTIATVAALGVVTLVILTALGAFAGTSTPPGRSNASGSGRRYYVSLGDSYSVGYQPSPVPGPTSGYTGYVAREAHLTLVNFGCGGATTTSILTVVGCSAPFGPPAPAKSGGVTYTSESQVRAATAFIRSHRRDIKLITVSIGGNDVTHCATVSNPTSCVLAVVPRIERNVERLADSLRAAAGAGVPIIGITYPDVLLGLWVYPRSRPDPSLASLSVTAFKSLLNPALEKAYASAGGRLVDITRASDGYVPLERTTTLAPYGKIPLAVARTCMLTWYCTQGNIHPKTAGYRLIGRQIYATYQSMTR